MDSPPLSSPVGNFPPGHFYSPIPDLEEIRQSASRLFQAPRRLPAVNLHQSDQIKLFHQLARYYPGLDFPKNSTPGHRFHYNNSNYGPGDAVILASMIRHFQPKRIIEIGSGFSSAVTLDINEKFFNNKIDCTFIEPYPELLNSLLQPQDRPRLIDLPLQQVPLTTFHSLQKNDILFIDSTHVSKIGSDVNYLIFEILPSLNSGVIIHFHDIFYPFEYLSDWVYQGFFWNEAYILRAFLEYNSHFKILFFTHFFYQYHRQLIKQKMPLWLKNYGGSLWLKKIK